MEAVRGRSFQTHPDIHRWISTHGAYVLEVYIDILVIIFRMDAISGELASAHCSIASARGSVRTREFCALRAGVLPPVSIRGRQRPCRHMDGVEAMGIGNPLGGFPGSTLLPRRFERE